MPACPPGALFSAPSGGVILALRFAKQNKYEFTRILVLLARVFSAKRKRQHCHYTTTELLLLLLSMIYHPAPLRAMDDRHRSPRPCTSRPRVHPFHGVGRGREERLVHVYLVDLVARGVSEGGLAAGPFR